MDSDSKRGSLPPSYEETEGCHFKNVLEPAVLVLSDQTVHAESSPSTPLYTLSGDVTSILYKNPSMKFERIEYDTREKGSTKQETQHLFYLVHPINAAYRKDLPPYYVTSMSTEMLGNVQFETSKSWNKKVGFKALLSPRRNAWNSPLFDDKGTQLLFTVKPNWRGGLNKWVDADGKEIATEEETVKGEKQRKLVVTTAMQRNLRDALVAMWALRLWHDTAESKEAKALDIECQAAGVENNNLNVVKGTVALGALAGAGG